ncbi:putative zinc finger and SCAN domain-containing protein 5C [Tetranychus urticae]|uniref:C2H2-type domain-containing protein n=1 Tax=Tetranychus urticae TaxID=32264 RepID=T1KLN3_TETUR|nr:putative zinc finger and SCAN domain-containing protein 5C [Tetranychus urticae]
MSSISSSKQFKQDINLLFNKLHSIISELEAKIVERDESLREEVKQDLIIIQRASCNIDATLTTQPGFTTNQIDQPINLITKSTVDSGNTINRNTSPNSIIKNTSPISQSVITTARSGTSCDNSSSRQDFEAENEPLKNMENSSSSNNQISAQNLHSTSLSSALSLSLSSALSPSSSSSSLNNRVKENRCPMCAQRFTQLNSLKRHIRSHTGERPFPCGYCEKRFVDRERLKVHVRIHTGEKPFSCNLCSRRFSQKSTVKRHMSVHTGLKPFQCGSCSKRFGTRDNLRVHEKSHFQVD